MILDDTVEKAMGSRGSACEEGSSVEDETAVRERQTRLFMLRRRRD
jgi:hypothetical protein